MQKEQFNYKGQSIRSKLIVTFIVISLLPLCVLSWFSFNHVTQSLKKSAEVELNELSRIGKQFSEIWFTDHVKDIYLLNDQLIYNPLQKKLFIDKFIARYDFVRNIHIVFDPQNTPNPLSNDNFVHLDQDALIPMLAKLEQGAQSVFISTSLPDVHHFIAMPIRNKSRELTSIVLVDVNFQGLLDSLQSIHDANPSLNFYLVKNGVIQGENQSLSFIADSVNNEIHQGVFTYSKNTNELYYAILTELNFADAKGWQLLVEKPSDVMLLSARQYKRIAVITSSIALVIILILSLWFARRLSRPLVQLAKATENITNGTQEHVPILTDSAELHQLSIDLELLVNSKEQQQTRLQQQSDALKHALKQLTEQKNALDEHAIVAITDIKGSITFANNKFCEISGYSEAELLGQNHRILNSGRHSKSFFKGMYKTLKQGKVWHGQICNKAKNGSYYWVDTTILPFFDEQGRTQSYIAVRTDITELKHQELELEQHKTQLQLVLDSTAVGIWDWYIDTDKVYFNNRWAEIIGYTLAELEPTSINTWQGNAHPDDLIVSEQKLAEHFCGQTDYYFAESRMRHKSGQWIWILDTGRVVEWNTDGTPKRMIGTHLDITERKEIETQLQQGRDRFASLVENIPGIVYRCKFDKQWTMLYMSDQARLITGYEPLDFINNYHLDFVNIIHPDDVALVEKSITAEVQKRKPWSIEYRLVACDGSIRWVHDKGQAVVNHEGELLYLDGFILDITEQYNTQAQLYRQQSLLETMSKQGQIGAWEVDLEHSKMFWSEEVKAIHEVAEDYQPKIDQALDFYKEGMHRDKISELFEDAIAHGRSWDVELIIITKTAKERWVKSIGQVEFKDGKCIRVYGSFQNIDTYKRLELESIKANQYNKNLASLTVSPQILSGNFDRVKDLVVQSMCEVLNVQRASVWLFDADSQEMHCMSLYIAQEGVQQQAFTLKVAEYPSYYKAIFAEGLLAINNVNTHPATLEFIKDYTKPLNIKSILDAVISTGDGILGVLCAESIGEYRAWSQNEETYLRSLATLVGSVVMSQNQKETAEELKIALAKANDAALAKSQFLATMSHEIRTPMNGVLGMLELIELEPLNKPIQTKVSIAKNSAHSLLSVINDILDFSKVEAGKIELESINFNACDLLGQVAESQALRAQEKSIEIILDVVGVVPAELKGDPGRIRQILTNLISNAVKFTQQGEVVITAHLVPLDERYKLTISVKDSGIGIDSAKQKDLFSPFSQVDASTTRQYGGTGLGLAICKQLCELMDGSVSLTSEVGKGSEFTASVMLLAGSETQQSMPTIDMNQLTILVVDDNETNRIVISQQLEHWGAKVELACDADQAISLCKNRVSNNLPLYDIGVLDMQMPDIDGIELCRILKADDAFKAMPLVMMTSIAGMEGAQRYSDAGFQAYFPKPITTADLISAMAVIANKNGVVDLPLVTSSYISSLRSKKLSNHILLVEDNPINQQVAKLMLSKLNYQVTLAENGQQALATLSKVAGGHFALVLMDCQMPVMDGFDTTRAIRAGVAGYKHQDITIIALTANAMGTDREYCLATGMNDYLAKPIQLDILKDKLEQY
ncbi:MULTISPECIES: PAS domain-containing protein [unclassified Pseudoalteromonas]|uniref:PAS domain-containing protein n=1 Tax=unclassified Pseudoalteromonas TaxID=194690 RepID=UPI0025B58E80|nr:MULTISPECIES: PAS domain-containing protein [unclassified Pseudoalteromonas]MDN3379826.1 PAS domain-containing protein [Pseudoalteromonas sp. APC 3893]MDN3388166.1 PAS domain-containing protein [Pseudoalteromonas sp. APC 4017]